MTRKRAHVLAFRHQMLRARPPPSSYKCETCSRTLTTAAGLKRHKIRYHTISKFSGFECYLCKKQFRSRESVPRHMKDFHVIGKPGKTQVFWIENGSVDISHGLFCNLMSFPFIFPSFSRSIKRLCLRLMRQSILCETRFDLSQGSAQRNIV